MKKLLILLMISMVIGCKTKMEDKIVIPEHTEEKKIVESVQEVMFNTHDNVLIKGSYHVAATMGSTPAILLHMLGKDRHVWDEFAVMLQSRGYSVLAIDLRGHGESIIRSDAEYKWQDFTESDFTAMLNDVKAAKDFLKKQSNVEISRLVVIGASIGANTALNYAVTDDDVKSVVLLSPGLNYRGVMTENSIKQLKQPVIIAAAKDKAQDVENAKILNEKGVTTELVILEQGGHGAEMLSLVGFKERIIDFIERRMER